MPLCDLTLPTFVQYFGGLYERAPWVVERAYNAGLTLQHDDPHLLGRALADVITRATLAEKVTLLQAHPDMLGDAPADTHSREWRLEQRRAGLHLCTDMERDKFRQLNEAYRRKFGFAFVMAIHGLDRSEILLCYERRLKNSPEIEFSVAVRELNRIARLRMDALLVQTTAANDEFLTEVDAGSNAAAGVTVASMAMVEEKELVTEKTAAQLRDPDYFPGFTAALPLGIQHVLAMFVSNVTPAIIIAGAMGFGFGSADTSSMIYMIQMSMFFAGIATLIQTVGLGPVGARLPIVQGTSFAFIPVMIPIAKAYGMAALMGGIVIGGVFHFFLGSIIGRLRQYLPPLVTGLVVLMIGLALVKVGIQYAAGGVPLIGKPEYGSLLHWGLASSVIIVTLILKFFTRGMLSMSAVLIGLLVGYGLAFLMGMVSFSGIDRAAWFALPDPRHFGFEVNMVAIIGMCLMAVVSAIETVGDISGITKGGAGREATEKEIAGGTMADGLGSAVSGIFGALPNTSFSQNVGLVSLTGVMSRHVVTLGALFLILCGLIPKVGAVIQTMPISVLGGGVIVMFGMVAAAGMTILSDVNWDRRNMVIFAIALSIGLGLQLEPGALQHLPDTAKVLMGSGLLPAAVIAIVLNIVIPEEARESQPAPQK